LKTATYARSVAKIWRAPHQDPTRWTAESVALTGAISGSCQTFASETSSRRLVTVRPHIRPAISAARTSEDVCVATTPQVLVFDAADLAAESAFGADMLGGRVFIDDPFHSVSDADGRWGDRRSVRARPRPT